MATQPAVTTVQFDDLTFLAFATGFSVFTPHDGTGMPTIGQSQFAIQISGICMIRKISASRQ